MVKEKLTNLGLQLNYVCYDPEMIEKLSNVWKAYFDLKKEIELMQIEQEIKVGDVVEVYCPELSQQRNVHEVKGIQDEYVIFDESIGKIQIEYCTKIKTK